MNHLHSHHHEDLRKMAASATLHCLLGCAAGEITGMALGAYFGWGNLQTVIVATSLAFISGYSFSIIPLIRRGMSPIKAIKLVFAADTLSIITMEIIDNSVMLLTPGAMTSHLDSLIFWLSMTLALTCAYIVAYPVNLYLLRRGKGHMITIKHTE